MFIVLSVAKTDTVAAQSQGITVTGKVIDANELPLIGVSVTVPKTTVGVVTDLDGKYSLRVPSADASIQFSYIGFKSQTIKINGKQVINVTLQEDAELLSEVVVVGYGTQKKETLVGAVSAIQTKDLLQSPQANISNALAGKMPGLFAVQRSGEPGKDESLLRIRGVATFAGDQNPLIMVDGIESDNYNNIDPNEIESISILKDASATAVYGVRGANGVLLITTKRGTTGAPRISLSSSVGRSSFPSLRKNMNAYEYTSSFNKGQDYDSYVTGNNQHRFTDADIELYRNHTDPILHPDSDWYSMFLRDASYQTRTNVNIGGGTERVKYFFSLGYFTQNGMINTDVYDSGYDEQIRYNRYNLRSNFDIKVTKRLNASFDISTQIDDSRGPNWSTESFMEMLSSVPPINSPGIIDNRIIVLPEQNSGVPSVILMKGWHQNYDNFLNGSVRLNYELDYITPGLKARGAVSYKNFNTQIQKYEQNGVSYEARRGTDGEVVYRPDAEATTLKFSEEVKKNRRIYVEAGLEYARRFGNHNVTGLVLYNQSKYHDPALEFSVPNAYQGIVGRATYDYQSRYLVEFNLGYNGTENFAIGKRFGFFPAYSLGWAPTEEPFFPKNDIITFLKIRGSYGEVGNDKVGGDRFLYRPTAYTYTNPDSPSYYFGEVGSSYQGYAGSNEGKLGNPDLTWEKAQKSNIGADMKFWKNKITATLDVFREERNNILCNRGTIPETIGANFPAYNLGEMKNSGWEGEIGYYDHVGKFNYSIRGNYSYAHNVIVAQDEAPWAYSYLNRTGQRYGQHFAWIAEGLYNTWEEVNDPNRPVYMWSNNKIQPGDIKYKDINGDGYIDNNDQVPIGYSDFPEKIFGLSLGGEYKGFDFSILFQGASNVSHYPSRRTYSGFYTNSGANQDLLKSWSQERLDQGLEIKYPRLSVSDNGHNYVWSTYWMEDATYLRLKNMEIGYTFQVKKAGISSIRLYMNGNNLLTWCNLYPGEDPEFPNGSANNEPYPMTRIYNFGFNINF
jgi:TonB-linked SusC/RagA family outer membrane protein